MEAGALCKVFWKGFKEDGESPSRERNYERLVFEKETRSTNFASSDVISYKSVVKPYRIQLREQHYFTFAYSEIIRLSIIILLDSIFIFISNIYIYVR